MLNNIIDILPVLFLLIIFWRAEIKPFGTISVKKYLTLDTCKYYRGIFSIVVLFHHLSQITKSGLFFRGFSVIGYLAVSYFFFISGYGLQKSYIEKGEKYKQGFLLKRLPPIIIPYIIVTFIYRQINLIEGLKYSLQDIIISIFTLRPIALFSWYVINIIVFYIVYLILMTICKRKYTLMLLGGGIWYFTWVVFCLKVGPGSWCYNTTHLLIVGMLWAIYEKKIISVIKKYNNISVIVTWFVFLLLFFYDYFEINSFNNRGFSLIIRLTIAIFFVLSVVMFSLKIQIGNKALDYLGKISYEIYISQGIFIMILRGKHIFIRNELFYCITVLIMTIIFSTFLKWLSGIILNISIYDKKNNER